MKPMVQNNFKKMSQRMLLSMAVASALFSCKNVGDDEFILEGTVKGLDGKNIVLMQQQEGTGITIPKDTVKIESGKFKFEGKVGEPSIHFLSIDGEKAKSFVILEHGEINIEINKDSIFLNKITGTYNNEQLTEFNASGLQIQKKIKAFENANRAKMNDAMNRKDTAVVMQLRADYDLIRKEMESTTEKYIKDHPKSFISVLLVQGMFNSYSPDVAKIEAFYTGLDAELKNTSVGKSISKKLLEVKSVSIGKQAPGFSAPNPEGKMVSLKEAMGKVTIIDFWASWCGPCRAENPNVVALYNEFHAKGLNIIGVSLDKPGQADKWKEAIAKDQLTWTQVSNLKHWEDPIAATYGVKSIPGMFLLNQYGVVVAKDLHGDALKAKINELLAAK